jgi:hypothetical protein
MTIAIVMLSLLTMQAPQPAAIVPPPHVRPQSTRSEEVLADAIKRSPTVAALVKTIERSPILVFIELVYDREDLGRTRIMTANEFARLLHVQLNGKLSADRLVEVLAHELQHAVEILGAPEIRDEDSLARAYTRLGFEVDRGHFETDAARLTELQVHTELQLERMARRGKGK